MQHNRAGRKLGRTTAHRKSLFRNQLSALITHERIQTTLRELVNFYNQRFQMALSDRQKSQLVAFLNSL